MTEKEINIRYIRGRLKRVVPEYMLEDNMMYEILLMLKEVYIDGLRRNKKEEIINQLKKEKDDYEKS